MTIGYVFGCDQMAEIRSKRVSAQLQRFILSQKDPWHVNRQIRTSNWIHPLNQSTIFLSSLSKALQGYESYKSRHNLLLFPSLCSLHYLILRYPSPLKFWSHLEITVHASYVPAMNVDVNGVCCEQQQQDNKMKPREEVPNGHRMDIDKYSRPSEDIDPKYQAKSFSRNFHKSIGTCLSHRSLVIIYLFL